MLLIPDGTLQNLQYPAVNAEKLGNIWVYDRGNPGGFNLGNSTCLCDNVNTSGATCTHEQGISDCSTSCWKNQNAQTLILGSTYHFHTSPAFWSGTGAGSDIGDLYYIGNTNPKLTQYRLCNSATSPICSGTNATNSVAFPTGATPSVSSNGTTSGVVWAIRGDGSDGNGVCYPNCFQAALYAFAAAPSSGTLTELYNSEECVIGTSHVDRLDTATKFSVPTVANGYVFVGTQKGFYIYGLMAHRSC